jgi:hypothetical protein
VQERRHVWRRWALLLLLGLHRRRRHVDARRLRLGRVGRRGVHNHWPLRLRVVRKHRLRGDALGTPTLDQPEALQHVAVAELDEGRAAAAHGRVVLVTAHAAG